ncbi:MAG TPA: cytochrome C, partial [Thalassospira sp.]|nr:cytochrome C [Thalassospira sp.]
MKKKTIFALGGAVAVSAIVVIAV